MILGTKARYAVMAMVELAGHEPGVPVTLAQIAQKQEITLPYLEQIFSRLKHGGLVQSVRGPGGGYVLARMPAQIRIDEIIAASDENLKLTRCEAGEGGCMATKAKCVTHDLWEGLEKHIQSYLQGMSLADLQQKAKNAKSA